MEPTGYTGVQDEIALRQLEEESYYFGLVDKVADLMYNNPSLIKPFMNDVSKRLDKKFMADEVKNWRED